MNNQDKYAKHFTKCEPLTNWQSVTWKIICPECARDTVDKTQWVYTIHHKFEIINVSWRFQQWSGRPRKKSNCQESRSSSQYQIIHALPRKAPYFQNKSKSTDYSSTLSTEATRLQKIITNDMKKTPWMGTYGKLPCWRQQRSLSKCHGSANSKFKYKEQPTSKRQSVL